MHAMKVTKIKMVILLITDISLEAGAFRNPLITKYKSSPEYTNLQATLQPILQQALYIPLGKMPQHAVNFFWQVRMYYANTCTHTHAHTCMHTDTCMHAHTCTHTHTHTRMHARTHTACTHTHAHMHTCTYTVY